MNRFASASLLLAASTMVAATAFASGNEIFNAKCVTCHRGGDNIMKKEKTLHKKDLDANKLKTADDLVKYFRNPGPGMPKFDAKALSDKEAKELAEYILKTFK